MVIVLLLVVVAGVGNSWVLYPSVNSISIRHGIPTLWEASHQESDVTLVNTKNELRILQEEYYGGDDDDDDDDDDTTENGEAWAYSKYATIVPDPEYQSKKDVQAEMEQYQEEWGSWHFWDDAENDRPAGDYCAKFPYRDVPEDEFDEDAWQVDAVFVNHILDSGAELVSRAQDAIFAEYGYGKDLSVDEKLERNKMFRWEKINMSVKDQIPPPDAMLKGGWTSQRSMDGLARRILHAIMTNDEFVVVVVGGAAGVGDGNHFRQSYAMQMHRVVAPVLARFGVKLVTRNLSHRHIGSLPVALGKAWGDEQDVDLVIWDEGHFESTRREKDIFIRQVLLSGREKVPMLWMGGDETDWELLRMYHEFANIDVGRFGTALYGIPLTTGSDTVQNLPHVVQYLHCDSQSMGVCRQAPDEYCASCWIDRPDIPDPKTLFPNMTDQVPSQRNWHPGWRQHQLTGRLLAYTLLDALQDAVQTFSTGTMGGPPLEASEWHVGEYYTEMREKLATLDPAQTGCSDWGDKLPARVCTVPLRGATQHTPRSGPSITDLIKTKPGSVAVENQQKVMYDGYDVHNACYDAPEEILSIVGVVSGRRLVSKEVLLDDDSLVQRMPPSFSRVHMSRMTEKTVESENVPRRLDSTLSLQTESGWQVVDESPGTCNGEYTSICGRQASSTCPLLGYHDSQGKVMGDDSAGWLVLGLDQLKKGLIILGLKLETEVSEQRRNLRHGDLIADLPESFILDVSVDGDESSWSKAEFASRYRSQLQRNLDGLIFLDDESFTATSDTVEIGLRLRSCPGCKVGVSHIFWA